MIKDITIGQYFPGKSVIHRMDARIKIILTAVFIVMLFIADSIWGLLVGIAFTILTFVISRIPGKLMRKAYRADHYFYGDSESVFYPDGSSLF